MTRRTLSFAIAGAVICGTAAGAYGVTAPRWASQQIAYYINPANSGLSEEETINAIQSGAMAWTSQSGANVLPYFAGKSKATSIARDGMSEVFFRANPGDFSYGKTYTWHDSNNRMIEADTVLYPGGITFASDVTACAGSGLYLQDVMTHEFGHALGLSHSSVPTASMNPAMPWCSKDARFLDADDLSKIEALYPSGGIAAVSATQTARPAATTSPTSFPFAAKGYKVNGHLRADLTWKGLTASTVDVYRNGAKIATVSNLGMYTDAVVKSAGSYSYAVCAAGTSTCSASVNVVF